MFCQYKNMFGKVGEGIHKYRICDIAIVDVLLTIFAAYILNFITSENNFMIILVILFAMSIILHHIFCVKTTIDKLIFQ